MTDPVEAAFAALLDRYNITYTRPDRDKKDHSNLDFFLPEFALSVEVKAWSCERLHQQLRDSGRERDGILVIVGLAGVKAFGALLAKVVAKDGE